ncbi:hypothetical protein SNE40_016437 [Patella caerulea]
MLTQVILVAAVSLAMAASHESKMNYQVMYDTSVNLTCSEHQEDEQRPGSTKNLQWILPNGDLVDKKTTNHNRVMYLQDGLLLHVKKVDDSDFGVYFCLIYTASENKYMVVKKGINVDGPYWGDLMGKYRQGLIIGSVAAAIVFVLMLGICYMFERHPVLVGRDSKYIADMKAPSPGFNKGIEDSAYDNAAIEIDEIKKPDNVNGKSSPVAHTKHVEIVVSEDNKKDDSNTHL